MYDGLDIVLVLDDAGSLEHRFLHGPAVDQFFADEDALGEVLWGLSDNLGTVRNVVEYDAGTDSTSVVNHLKYDSFGNVTSESNASASPLLKFTGRYFDEDVDLQWNWQRWYDSATGLWLSEDPLGFGAGDTNLYRYVGNSPTNYVDPFGLTTEEPFGAPPLNPVDYPEVYEMMARFNGSNEEPGDWGAQGYSSYAVSLIGEWIVRPILGDDRLAQPGDTADDLLLTARLATELTGYVDPTPMSDLLNATVVFMGGDRGEAAVILAGAALPGGLDKIGKAVGNLPANQVGRAMGAFAGATDEMGSAVGRRGGRDAALSGRPAEDAVSAATGVPVNRGPEMQGIPGSGPGGVRYPDMQPDGPNGSIALRGSLMEVKDRPRVYASTQIKDMAEYADAKGLVLELFTDAPIPATGDLPDLINRGIVVPRPIPWPTIPDGT